MARRRPARLSQMRLVQKKSKCMLLLPCHLKTVDFEAFSSKIWRGQTSMVKVEPNYYYPWKLSFWLVAVNHHWTWSLQLVRHFYKNVTRKRKLDSILSLYLFETNHQCSESACTLNQSTLVIPILKIYDIHCTYLHDFLHAQKTHFCFDKLYITPYRIFSCCVSCTGLSIGVVYLWIVLEKYKYTPSSKPLESKLKRTKQTKWVNRTGQLPDWHYGVDQADLTDSDCFLGSDRTGGL